MKKDYIFSDLIVKHGPFKGMKYAENSSINSAFMPKLMGSYERELHPVMEKVCNASYETVVNVGCGEGYYAVGLAMRQPIARVYAYDIDPEAIRLCTAMALLNNVGTQVFTYNHKYDFTPLPLNSGLIICDCEGGEQDIFTQDSAPFFKHWDLIIEAHDFVTKKSTSKDLQELFKSTHNVQVIQSISDNEKPEKYSYPELENCDREWVRGVLAENRPVIMEWVVAFSIK